MSASTKKTISVYENEKSDMTELQRALLSLFKRFDCVCRENNLRYYLCGGSALGAVRHQGFIPWDDDIDVVMPRKDFIKLVNDIKLSDELDVYLDDQLLFGTFVDKRVLVSHGDDEWDRNAPFLSLDITIADGAPSNSVRRWIHTTHVLMLFVAIKLKRIRYIQKTEGMKNRASRPLKEKLLIRFGGVFNLLLRGVPEGRLVSAFYSSSGKYDFYSSDYVGAYCGRYRYKEIFPKDVFGAGKPVQFEDIEARTYSKSEVYLSRIYGPDYMQLPSMSNRERHGDARIVAASALSD